MSARDPALQALLDKQANLEVLHRYSRGADRGDAELIAACYHPDATEDHGGTFTGRASDYIDKLAPILPRAGVMTHLVTNILVELDGNAANVECYITTFARMKKDGVVFDSMTCARAIDRFEKHGDDWRIAARRMTWEWNHDMERRETWGRGYITEDPKILVRGAKKPNDRLYTGQ